MGQAQRPGWNDYFMRVAYAVAARATCSRRSVGAVLVDQQQRILTTGYNGAPRGASHCDHSGGGDLRDAGGRPSCAVSVHAEQNAVLQAARSGVALQGSTCYVTTRPCSACAGLLAEAGVKEVYWSEDHSGSKGVEEFFKKVGIVEKQLAEGVNCREGLPPHLAAALAEADAKEREAESEFRENWPEDEEPTVYELAAYDEQKADLNEYKAELLDGLLAAFRKNETGSPEGG